MKYTETSLSLNAPQWDLNDLFSSPEDPKVTLILESAIREANDFANRYRNRIASLTVPELLSALIESERIRQDAQKPVVYASLRFSTDTAPDNGAFLQSVRERFTEATLPLLFFDLELTQLPEPRLTELSEDVALQPYKHYLLMIRDRARFRLSEAEERVLEEAQNTGRRAWVRLSEETISGLRFTLDTDETQRTLSEIIHLQQSADRSVRSAAAEALTAGLTSHLPTLTYIYNTLIADKATEDRLRGYAYPEEARHTANELHPDVVETVVQVSEAGYPLVARYYRAKRKLLGLPELTHYDRYAPLTDDPQSDIPFTTARDVCLSAFAKFHPEYQQTAEAFFANNWIDGAVHPGKRGGAYCAYVTADLHPYIFMNYLGRVGDVRTLAHELGHGIHTSLARPKGFYSFHGTLPMAEVASTFAEQLVFTEMEKSASDDSVRLSLYAEQIEQAMGTIFRQTALYRFEQSAHRERREHGEIRTARFGELWQSALGAMFGDSVHLLPGHACWWSYIPHFIGTPFYVYAYTWGELLALALYKKCQDDGVESFAPRFLDFLRQGGSLSPQQLVDPLGVDLADAGFWQGALAVLETQIAMFEKLAETKNI